MNSKDPSPPTGAKSKESKTTETLIDKLIKLGEMAKNLEKGSEFRFSKVTFYRIEIFLEVSCKERLILH